MNPVKTDEVLLEKLHNQWLGNLAACEQHLNGVQQIVRQLQESAEDSQFQNELDELRNNIENQKSAANVLCQEVLRLRRRFTARNEEQPINLADLVENNKMRDKVRKTEQSVFVLKTSLNKILSSAS